MTADLAIPAPRVPRLEAIRETLHPTRRGYTAEPLDVDDAQWLLAKLAVAMQDLSIAEARATALEQELEAQKETQEAMIGSNSSNWERAEKAEAQLAACVQERDKLRTENVVLIREGFQLVEKLRAADALRGTLQQRITEWRDLDRRLNQAAREQHHVAYAMSLRDRAGCYAYCADQLAALLAPPDPPTETP